MFRHFSLFGTIIYCRVGITFIHSDSYDANDYRVKENKIIETFYSGRIVSLDDIS